MVKVSLLELFARGIPEAALFILASYLFSGKDFNLKRFFTSALLLAVAGYLIRLLPIQPGVNNILNMIALIIINVNMNKIYMISSIKIVITTFIIQFLCEGINMLIVKYLFKINLEYAFSTSKLKILYGMPSLVMFGMILGIYHIFFSKRKKLKEH